MKAPGLRAVALVALVLPRTLAQQLPTTQQLERLRNFKDLLQRNPRSPAANSNYGAALKAAHRADEAIPFLERAVELDPTYARGWTNLGSAHHALGGPHNLQLAVEHHVKAIALMPELASAYNNLGNALRELGQPTDAVAALKEAVRVDENYGAAYLNLGAACSDAGMHDEAVAAARRAVDLLGAAPEAHNVLGAALEGAGRPDEAVAAYEAGLDLQPRSVTMLVNLGNALRAAGRNPDAVKKLSSAIALEPDGQHAARAYNSLGAALQAEGKQKHALSAYTDALKLKPDLEEAQSNLEKLPAGPFYRAQAARETGVLAWRAAAAALAAWGEARAGRGGPLHGRGGSVDEMLSVRLYRTVAFLRLLETDQLDAASYPEAGFWDKRGDEMADAMQRHDSAGGAMTAAAFAWGGVWYDSFAAVFTHREVRAAIAEALQQRSGSAAVLGSNLGFEAYFIALGFGLKTDGVEILCDLNRVAENVRRARAIPDKLARFHCGDALKWTPARGLRLLYIDDTAWDPPSLEQLAAKLARELPDGTIVIHNSLTGFSEQPRFRLLQVVEVATSWSGAHRVLVHTTQPAPDQREL